MSIPIISTFAEMPLHPDVLNSIEAVGYTAPTEIQQKAIPIILEGKDLLGTAQTGTGKTAAFAIPLIHHLMQRQDKRGVKALIISPTRELAQQIDQIIEGLSYGTGVASVAIYGGSDKQEFDRQMAAIRNGADILVATPGRLLQHLNLLYSNMSSVEFLILDEADKMLDMGFFQDILKIVKEVPVNRQTIMFSATMPPKIKELTQKILKPDAAEISMNLSIPAAGIDQRAYVVYENQKLGLLKYLLENEEIDSMICFAPSKLKADEVYAQLSKLKASVEVIHSDKDQETRSNLMRRFKNKEFPILVATDIISRGIDIDSLSHVLNFSVPHDAEDYVHRIGRTARSGKKGVAMTFIGEKEQYRFREIEKLIQREVPKMEVPKDLGETPQYSGQRENRPPRPQHQQRPKGNFQPKSPNGNPPKKKRFFPKKPKPPTQS